MPATGRRRLVVSVAAATLLTFGVLRLDVLVDDYCEVSLRDVLTLAAG